MENVYDKNTNFSFRKELQNNFPKYIFFEYMSDNFNNYTYFLQTEFLIITTFLKTF